MIRKAIIVALLLAAVGVSASAWMSESGPWRTSLWQIGNARFGLYVSDTLVRAYWFQRHEPISLDFRETVRPDGQYVRLQFDSGPPSLGLCLLTREGLRSAGIPNHGVHRVNIRFITREGLRQLANITKSSTTPQLATNRLSVTLVRSSMWTVSLLLAAYPTMAFIRGPLRRYRRRKHGLCLACAYDLTGNKSGVCPECGEPT